jgi:CRP-like cAMP-binding protein
MEEVFKFLSQYVVLTKEEKDIIAENSSFLYYPAGHLLLKEGQYAKNCYFVVKGLLRSYYLKDGEEKIIEFYSEMTSVSPVSYTTGEASEYYISCVEDTILSTSDENHSEAFFEKLPRLKDYALKFLTDMNTKQQLSYHDFKNLEPGERYEKLLEARPDLISRVPQYMIASYLGIKPQSLSRIRKRKRDNKTM